MKLYKDENTYIDANKVFNELPTYNDDICGLYECIEFPHIKYYDSFLKEMQDPIIQKYIE